MTVRITMWSVAAVDWTQLHAVRVVDVLGAAVSLR
jgi:hypothetical protein